VVSLEVCGVHSALRAESDYLNAVVCAFLCRAVTIQSLFYSSIKIDIAALLRKASP